MALDVAHGRIEVLSTDVATTVKTVSGLSFQPKAIIFWWTGQNSAVDAASAAGNQHSGFGFAVDTSNRRCVGAFSQNGAATSNCGSVARDDAVMCTTDGAAASDGEVDLNSITSDGFTLIVDDQLPISVSIFWVALGGSDISVAVVGDIAEPAATGDQDYTVTGFESGAAVDQVVFFAGTQSVAAVNTAEAEAAGLCFGYATGTGSEGVVSGGNQDDASTAMDCDGFQLGNQVLGKIAKAGAATVESRATFVQFGTDNFRLNWAARAATGRRNIFLAIKGGRWRVGETTINSTSLNNTSTISGLSFAPKGIFAMGDLKQAEDASNAAHAHWRMSVGFASSTSSRRAMCFWNEDATASSNCEVNYAMEYDGILCSVTNAGAIDGVVDVDQFNSDGFRLTVDDTDAGGNASAWIGYLTFGDAPANITLTVDDMTHSHAIDDAGALTQAHTLAMQELLHDHLIDAAGSLTQANILAMQDMAHSHTIDNLDLVQAHTLAGLGDLFHDHTMDEPTVTQSFTLSIADMAHDHFIDDAGGLVQAHTLALADMAHAHTMDNVELVQANLLAGLGDLTHGHTIDNVALTQAHTLGGIGDLLHAHSIDDVGDLTQANLLAPNDLQHWHHVDGELITYTDDFNRPDEELEDSGDWVASEEILGFTEVYGKIEGNRVVAEDILMAGFAGGALALWHQEMPANCYAKIRVASAVNVNSQVYLGLRAQPYDVVNDFTPGMYMILDATEFPAVNSFGYLPGGGFGNALVDWEQYTVQDGDVFEVRVWDNNVALYINGVVQNVVFVDHADNHGTYATWHEGYYLNEPGGVYIGIRPQLPNFDDPENPFGFPCKELDDFETGSIDAGLELIQHNVLNDVGDLAHDHLIDAAGNLTQAHVLALADMLHDHTIESFALTQQNVLALADMMHAHSLDAITLSSDLNLEPAGMDHAHTIDGVELTQQNVLALADMMHAHGFDSVELIQANLLAMQDMLHGHSLDELMILPDIVLSVNDILHAHRLDGFSVSILETISHTLEVPKPATEVFIVAARVRGGTFTALRVESSPVKVD